MFLYVQWSVPRRNETLNNCKSMNADGKCSWITGEKFKSVFIGTSTMEYWTVFTLLSILLAVAFLWGCYYLIRSGCFHVVQVWIGRPDFHELQIAYKMYKGNYMKSGEPFELITKLLPNMPCINAYYDDPEKVPPEECRYICGVVLSEGLDDTPDVGVIRKAKDYGFKIHNFPRVEKVMKSSFPFTTKISPMIGAMKVYPRLAKYCKENDIAANPYLEICKDGVIHYMCILGEHHEFFVEECEKGEINYEE